MAQQLAYVIITPYTLHKSRTGGILARLITRTGLELAAARMFAPSAELVRKYSDVIISSADPQDRRIQELIRDYILAQPRAGPQNQAPAPGHDAVVPRRGSGAQSALGRRQHLASSAAEGKPSATHTATSSWTSTTRCDTSSRQSWPRRRAEEAAVKLKLWASYSDSDGGVVDDTLTYGAGRNAPTHPGAHQAGQFPFCHGAARQRH